MKDDFYKLIILPLAAVSALLLILHDWLPCLYGDCVRPLVMMMRSPAMTVESEQNIKTTEHLHCSLCFSMSFDSQRCNVIRLIRLDSDYDEPETDNNTLKESA